MTRRASAVRMEPGKSGKATIMGPAKITPTAPSAPSGKQRPSGAAAVFDMGAMGASTAITLVAFLVIAGLALWFVIRPMFLAA